MGGVYYEDGEGWLTRGPDLVSLFLRRRTTERIPMSARDRYHDVAKNALVKDGWTITHDPFPLKWGKKDLFVDLAAEKVMTAEKEGRKIVVEVKSFLGRSDVEDLRNALGQFILYRDILEEKEPDRELFLAIREKVFIDLFEEPIGAILLRKRRLQLIVFDQETEEIVRWIP
jgi:hypothetical protein